ncbi:MAG: hypothetical protein HY651_08275 [Acidobacteria bacterium]|nr:hypothetical protein [Acidobacteriota bacterium]
MSNGAGSFEKAFEELIRRVLREEIAAGAVSSAPSTPAAAAEAAPSAGPGFSELNQAVNNILQPTGQADIMAAALRGAMTLAGRCALFVRRGDNFSAWRAEGYAGQTATAIRSVTVSATQPGIFKELCDTQRPMCRQRVAGILPPALEQALGSAMGPSLCLLPVLVQGKVVAALYSDAGGSSGSEEMSGLEIVAKVTGLSLETAASRVGTESPRAAAAPMATETPPEPVRLETPAPAPAVAEAAPELAPSRGSFAAGFPVAREGGPALSPPPDADALPEAERDSHKKAHRFARVAVQDLLSYHKDKIEQGRRNKNLFTLLKEDIEKTRENYQKRFGQTPARAFDYLHYEMVSKLAGNDMSVLGDQYPGPWAGD